MVLHDIALVVFDPIDNDQSVSCPVTEQYPLLHLPKPQFPNTSTPVISTPHIPHISLLPRTLTPQTHPFTP